MIKGVVLNEKITAIMAEAGVGMQYYTVLCPICGKETTLMVGKGEDLNDRVEIHLRELEEYHTPNDWAECDEEVKPESRAPNCKACGHPLGPYNPNDTSTWRTDDFCSARCKKANKRSR